MRVNTRYIKDVPVVEFMYLAFIRMPSECYRRRLRSLLLCLKMYLWRSLCTMYLKCTSGGVNVPCIYTHAMWELPKATQGFVLCLTPLCVDSARALWASFCFRFVTLSTPTVRSRSLITSKYKVSLYYPPPPPPLFSGGRISVHPR